MTSVALARDAMATRFEVVLHGENPVSLRAAGEEALDEIERLEAQLSLYRPTSEIARLNARAARQPVRVEPGLFRMLQHAQQLCRESGGTFDITVGPLMRCWGFLKGSGALPSPEEIEAARAQVGMQHVQLNPKDFTVQFLREGMMLDLGAIGKGYAIEQAADILREIGVTSALLHGGTSTIVAIGHPPDADDWKVAIEYPKDRRTGVPPVPEATEAGEEGRERSWDAKLGEAANRPEACPGLLAVVPLRNESLSVSAVWGKSFQSGTQTYGHIIDPRTGQPASRAALAAVALPSATETDALSTALLTVGIPGHDAIANLRPGMRTLLLAREGENLRVETRGIAEASQRR